MRQPLHRETGLETPCETVSLKSLANKVLARQQVRHAVRLSVRQEGKICLTPETPVRQNYGSISTLVPSDFPTGLEWLPGPPDDADPAFPAWWAALDLQDIGRCFGVRIVRAGERVLAVYPPGLAADLVDAASEVVAEARSFLAANRDKLPVLTPTDAVAAIKEIMRKHKVLRFTRGECGSMWPLYPRTWTANQKQAVQSLWFVAGDALDRDDFKDGEA